MNAHISGTTAQPIATSAALNTTEISSSNDVFALNIYHMQNLLGYGDRMFIKTIILFLFSITKVQSQVNNVFFFHC